MKTVEIQIKVDASQAIKLFIKSIAKYFKSLWI